MIVVMSLLWCDDYSSAICAAVQTGFDTDCNGATVGSIFGMLHGSTAVGSDWTAPVNNTLNTSIIHHESFKVDELVAKTLAHMKAARRVRHSNELESGEGK